MKIIMSYLNCLPKELRDLLDWYINHDYWCCLSEIYSIIFSTRRPSNCFNEFPALSDNMIKYVDRYLSPNLKQLPVKYQLVCDIPTEVTWSAITDDFNSRGYLQFNYFAKVLPNQIITKDVIFKVLEMYVDNKFECGYEIIKLLAEINLILEQYGITERIAPYKDRAHWKITYKIK